MTTLTWAEARDILTEIAEVRPIPLRGHRALWALRPVAAAALAEVERLQKYGGCFECGAALVPVCPACNGLAEVLCDEDETHTEWVRKAEDPAQPAGPEALAEVEQLRGALGMIAALPERKVYPEGGGWNNDRKQGLSAGRCEAANIALAALAQPAEPSTDAPLSERPIVDLEEFLRKDDVAPEEAARRDMAEIMERYAPAMRAALAPFRELNSDAPRSEPAGQLLRPVSGERERIARIIDHDAFKTKAEWYAELGPKMVDQIFARLQADTTVERLAPRRNIALTKADAILKPKDEADQ